MLSKKRMFCKGRREIVGKGEGGEIYLKRLSSRQQQSLSIYIAYALTTLCMYVAAAYLTYLLVRCGQVRLSESVTGIRQAEGQKESRTEGGNGHSVRQLSSICKR